MKKKKRKGFANRFSGEAPSRCAYCGSPVHLRSADGIYKENRSNAQLYVCSRYPECDAYVPTLPGTTRPAGTMANGNLRALRIRAHRSFDQLHYSGLMTRKEAYQWLALMLQAPLDQSHIGYLSDYYCEQVIKESDKLMADYRRRKQTANAPPGQGGLKYVLERRATQAG